MLLKAPLAWVDETLTELYQRHQLVLKRSAIQHLRQYRVDLSILCKTYQKSTAFLQGLRYLSCPTPLVGSEGCTSQGNDH